MSAIIARLLGPLGTYLFGGAAILFFVMWLFANGQAGSLKKALNNEVNAHAVTKSGLAQCRENGKRLDDSLAKQNAAVADLVQRGVKSTQAANAALKAAEKATRVYRDSAAHIAAAKPGPDLCQSARALIVDTLKKEGHP